MKILTTYELRKFRLEELEENTEDLAYLSKKSQFPIFPKLHCAHTELYVKI